MSDYSDPRTFTLLFAGEGSTITELRKNIRRGLPAFAVSRTTEPLCSGGQQAFTAILRDEGREEDYQRLLMYLRTVRPSIHVHMVILRGNGAAELKGPK